MTHREDCESYLRGLEGTRKSQIDWFGVKTGRIEGDVRSIPKIDIPMLIKEIARIKSILAVFPPSCPSDKEQVS